MGIFKENLKTQIISMFTAACVAGGVLAAGLSSVDAFAKKGGQREKFITREAKTSKGGKAGDKTKVNFDEVDIGGQRKTPFGDMITNNKLKKDYDFIKIRQRWHPEMIESASSLEAGAR
jgi:hypothetical protein